MDYKTGDGLQGSRTDADSESLTGFVIHGARSRRDARGSEEAVRSDPGGEGFNLPLRTGDWIVETRGTPLSPINSKRLDFLVIDRIGMPAPAAEHQGHGHYQNRAFMRDAVKREAVRETRFHSSRFRPSTENRRQEGTGA